MSRMSEYAAEQEQQENLSGNDIFECQAWQEMQAEIERLIPFKADFEKFVMSQEEQNVREV